MGRLCLLLCTPGLVCVTHLNCLCSHFRSWLRAWSLETGAPGFRVCASRPGLPPCTDALEKAGSFWADGARMRLLALVSSLLLGCGVLGRVELSADGFGGCV